MIGQGMGLPYLVPMALDHLEKHPLARGDFYGGDLLKNVAMLPEPFWHSHPHLRPRLIEALQRAVERVHKSATLDELADVLRDALARHRAAGAA
jgi:contact-dependent growth inhibition (CDI) system CdiI-like immunity protein